MSVESTNGIFDDIKISGITTHTAYITWTFPTLPSNAVISEILLTGELKHTMTSRTASTTINGKTYTSSTSLNINLGTDEISSLEVTTKGSRNKASGTVSITDIVISVTYTASETSSDSNIFVGDNNVTKVILGRYLLKSVYIGDSLVFNLDTDQCDVISVKKLGDDTTIELSDSGTSIIDESGAINVTPDEPNSFTSLDYFMVESGASYSLHYINVSELYVYYYSEDFTYISTLGFETTSQTLLSISRAAKYLRFQVYNANGEIPKYRITKN